MDICSTLSDSIAGIASQTHIFFNSAIIPTLIRLCMKSEGQIARTVVEFDMNNMFDLPPKYNINQKKKDEIRYSIRFGQSVSSNEPDDWVLRNILCSGVLKNLCCVQNIEKR